MSSKNIIVDNTLSFVEGNTKIEVASPAWFAWLHDALVFYYCTEKATFTARKQPRRGTMYWYAYARQKGTLHCVYIGRTEDLTAERLEAVAQRFVMDVDAPVTTVTSDIMGSGSRAARQTAMLLERLSTDQGGVSIVVAKEQLEDLRTVVQQRRRLTGQAACYALDCIAMLLEALAATGKNAIFEREGLRQEVHRLRNQLSLTSLQSSNANKQGEVF
jgi:hypothetical protein